MTFANGIVRAPSLDVNAALEDARRQGVTAYALPAAGVADYIAFFDWVRQALPLDPPIQRAGSWDALKDSLWSGLFYSDAQRFVIIWPNSEAMLPADDRETALFILGDVATNLADSDVTRGRPKELCILVG